MDPHPKVVAIVSTAILVVGFVSVPRPLGDAPRAAAQTASPRSEIEVYTEDFQDGYADNWESGYERKFSVRKRGGNFVLRAGGRAPVLAYYRGGLYWRDHILWVDLKLTSGEARIHFRSSNGRRYIVGATTSTLYLAKTARRERVLERRIATHAARRWYRLRIEVRGDRLSVYENGEPMIRSRDRNPVPFGGIALETTGGSVAMFDDIKVVATVPFRHTWTGTKGPEGLGGGGVATLAIDPSNPGVVYAGAQHSALYRSGDGGVNWTQITDRDGLIQTKVIDVAVAPSDSRIVYVGHQTAGSCCASKSTDGGGHWTRMDLPGRWIGVRSLAVHPSDPDVVYAAPEVQAQHSSDATGLYRSHNGGRSWTHLDIPIEFVIDVVVSPVAPDRVYAASEEGVFVSEDAGRSWHAATTGLTNLNIVEIAAHPTASDTAFARAGGGGPLFKTEDGGDSWREVKSPAGAVAVSPSSPETVYLAWAHSVARSTDGGETWDEGPTLPVARPINEIEVDPGDPDRLYIAGEKGVLVSHDAARTVSDPHTRFIGDFTSAVAVDPRDPQTLYVGHGAFGHGDISKSTDGGETWESLLTLVPGAFSPVNAVAVSAVDPDLLFASNLAGVLRSEDAGTTWNPVNDGLSDPRIISLALDPSDSDRLFAGTGSSRPQPVYDGTGMFRSVDRGETWTEVPGLPDVPVPAIVFDPLDSDTVYAAAMGRGVYRSVDGGDNWDAVNGGLENLYIYSLAIDPLHPTTLYAGTLEYYGNPAWPSYPDGPSPYEGLYKTVNGGSSWTRVFGAPEYPSSQMIENIAVDPIDPENVYITEHSELVWHSPDGGSTWRLANQGLVMGGAHLYMWALAISPDGSVLYMGNCGRGVFRNRLREPESSIPPSRPSGAGVDGAHLAADHDHDG